MRTTCGGRGSRTRSSRSRNRTSLDGSERERRGNHEAVLRSPGEMLERLPRDAAAAHARGRRPLHVRPDAGARLPLPGLLRRRRPCRRAAARRSASAPFTPRYDGAARWQRSAGAGAARRGAGADRAARAWRLLPAALGGARARARVRARGARPRLAAARAAAGQRTRLERRLARLLPDRPLARRPGRREPLARTVPERRDGHRSRTSTSTSRATSARS